MNLNDTEKWGGFLYLRDCVLNMMILIFENQIIKLVLDNILESLNKEIEARLLTIEFELYVVNRKIISCVFLIYPDHVLFLHQFV